jgi:hypothetical protein
MDVVLFALLRWLNMSDMVWNESKGESISVTVQRSEL